MSNNSNRGGTSIEFIIKSAFFNASCRFKVDSKLKSKLVLSIADSHALYARSSIPALISCREMVNPRKVSLFKIDSTVPSPNCREPAPIITIFRFNT